MRTASHGTGSILHVTQRGVRGTDLVHDMQDREAFVRGLRFLNDSYCPMHWRRDTTGIGVAEWPHSWPERKTLVRVLGWTLLSNHFHLIIQATQEGGVAKFMQRLCGSMSAGYNARYGTRGSLFQGSYQSVLVEDDTQFRYLVFYVLVKNVLDMYPGGVANAARNFDAAWDWAKHYRFSSFAEHMAGNVPSCVDDPEQLVREIIGREEEYKKESQDLLAFHLQTKGEEFKGLILESW